MEINYLFFYTLTTDNSSTRTNNTYTRKSTSICSDAITDTQTEKLLYNRCLFVRGIFTKDLDIYLE